MSGGPITYYGTQDGGVPSNSIQLDAFADIDCGDTDMITFTLPTTTIGGFAVPGGGGTISVVFS